MCTHCGSIVQRVCAVMFLHAVVEDPKVSAASLPEPTFDTTNNVDTETVALLATLPPDQQAQYLAAAAAVQAADSGATAGSGTGASSGSGASGSSGATGSNNATQAAAAAELLAVFETLKTSIADGSMERNTGYQTLDLSATVM